MSIPIDFISIFNVGAGVNDGFDLLWKRESRTGVTGEHIITLNLDGYKMLYVVCDDEAMLENEDGSFRYFIRETGHFLIIDEIPYDIRQQVVKSLAVNEKLESAYRVVEINENTITFSEQRGGLSSVNPPTILPNAYFGYFVAPLRIYGIR